jgi:hypothetical protein
MTQDNTSQHGARTVTAPIFITKMKMQALCLAAGKRDPTPSLSTEIAPLCQFQTSKKDVIAGRPSFLTFRRVVGISYQMTKPGKRSLGKGR